MGEAVDGSRGLAHFAGRTRALYGTRSSCHMAEVRACIISPRANLRASARGHPGLVDELRDGPGSARTQTGGATGAMEA